MYSVNDVLPGSDQAYWDGRFDGTLVNPGVFVYRIDVTIGGRTEKVVGDVTVIR